MDINAYDITMHYRKFKILFSRNAVIIILILNVKWLFNSTQCILLIAEITQINELSSAAVAQLLPELFKPWCGKVEISVADTTKAGLDHKWLTRIWRYLQNYFPSNLDKFQSLHLMPLSNEVLVTLDRKLPIIAKTDSVASLHSFNASSSLPREVVAACQTLGIWVIDNVAQEIRNHPQVWNNYILSPSVEGILAALIKVTEMQGRDHVLRQFSTLPDGCRLCLREYIAKGVKGRLVSDSAKDILKRLPYFLTIDGSGMQKAHFVSIHEVSMAAPKDPTFVIPVASSELLLNLQDESSTVLAECLGVKSPNVPEILSSVYFPAVVNNYYNDSDVVKFMKFVCEHLRVFQDISYKHKPISELSKEVRFVSKDDGRLVRPSELFDPHDELLRKLFQDRKSVV